MGLLISAFAFSFGFGVSGVLLATANLLGSGIPTAIASAIILLCGVGAYLFVLKRQIRKYETALKLWNERGDGAYESLVLSEIKKSVDTVYKSKLAINLCCVYTENGDIKSAKGVLCVANPKKNNTSFNAFLALPNKFKMLYYNNLVNLNLLDNDVGEASRNFADGESFFNEFAEDENYKVGLLHTRAMLELANGRLETAMSLVLSALSVNNSKSAERELRALRGKILSQML